MKRDFWLIFASITAFLISGCESSDDHTVLAVSAYNLDSPIELAINGRSYTVAPPDTYGEAQDVLVRSKQVHLADVSVYSHPESQACIVDSESEEVQNLNSIRVRCEDIRRYFSDVTDFALSEGSLCVANGSEVRCWGFPASLSFSGLLQFDGSTDIGYFENPRLLTLNYQGLCLMTDDGLKCSKFSGVDVESVNAQMQNVKEMALFNDVICYIDDLGLNCIGEEGDDLVDNAPVGLINPTHLVADVRRGRACVIAGGKPHCWGGFYSYVPEGLTDVQSIAIRDYYACAAQPSGVHCWQPESFSGDIDWQPEQAFAPYLLAFNGYSTCTADIDGVKCWGDYQVGNVSAEVALTSPDKLVFNELGGCAIEDRSLICFGDPIAPQLDYSGQ